MRSHNSIHEMLPAAHSGLSPPASPGFTLIETMMVLAILSIIIAFAYPNYIDQLRKSRRADAVSSLMNSAQLLERCFTHFNSYSADGCPDPTGASADGYYDITIVRTATTYTLTATPNGDQVSDPCGALTLDYLGNKTPTADSDRCWGSS